MIIAQTRDIYSISIGRLNSLDWHQCTESIIRPLRPTQWWTSSCPCEPCPLGWEPAVGHEGQRCHEAGWQQWENPSLYHKPRGPTTQRQGKRFNSAYCNISSLSQVKDTMMLTLMKTNMWYWSHHEKGGNSKKKKLSLTHYNKLLCAETNHTILFWGNSVNHWPTLVKPLTLYWKQRSPTFSCTILVSV